MTGNHKNVLAPGELLRSIHLPASALKKRFAFRRSSLTHLGRSAALLIGTRAKDEAGFLLTVTAATARPMQLRFDRFPSVEAPRSVGFNVQGVRVAVHRVTGEVMPLQSVHAADIGRLINPMQCRGQIDGAVAMGFG